MFKIILIINLLFPNGMVVSDYIQSCKFAQIELTATSKSGLSNLLAHKTLINISSEIDKNVQDTINYYTESKQHLILKTNYNLMEFDSVIKLTNVNLAFGYHKFFEIFRKKDISNEKRVFALKVLIGIITASQIPNVKLIGVPDKHRISKEQNSQVSGIGQSQSISHLTNLLYDSYSLGERLLLDKSDEKLQREIILQGYKNAGHRLANLLNELFDPGITIRKS